MSKSSPSFTFTLIGVIGIGVFLLMEYAHVVPDLTTKNPDFVVHIWIAWLVVSSLSLISGIIIGLIKK